MQPLESPTAPDAAKGGTKLDDAVNELQMALVRAMRLNIDELSHLRNQVETVRRRLLPLSSALDALGAVVACVAIAIGLWAARGALADATDRRELSEARAQELDHFAARIAHDLLGPLMTVGLALGLARLKMIAAGERDRVSMLSRAEASLATVRRLADGLLCFARAGGRPASGASTDLAAVFDEVYLGAQDLAEAGRVVLRATSQVTAPVACSRGILISLTANLVQNAISHMGKTVTRIVEMRAFEMESVVRVEVEDTGPGVSKDLARTMFDPFVRGEAARATGRGFGLGLATVKKLAESHGGNVGVESTVGEGSVFWFTVPKAKVLLDAPGPTRAPVSSTMPTERAIHGYVGKPIDALGVARHDVARPVG